MLSLIINLFKYLSWYCSRSLFWQEITKLCCLFFREINFWIYSNWKIYEKLLLRWKYLIFTLATI